MDENCFVSDIILPKMLYALTVRSPIAKGKLISIDCPTLPEGYTLLSAKDIPGTNCLGDSDMPILASSDLSYIGEPVALLLGPDMNVLEEKARNCVVIVEEGDPVFNAADANNLTLAVKKEFSTGDVDAAFSGAASVIRNDYVTGIQEHWYAEPCGAVAWPETQDKLVLRTATQWPYHVTRSVCGVLGIAAAKLQVIPTITGLHMDGKLWYPSLISCHAALGAWISKQPVRLVLTREEDFSFSPKRFATELNIACALNEKGDIAGLDINAIVNLGAYMVNANEALDHVYLGSSGVYKTKNIRFSGSAVRTNIPPQGPFAGFGLAQGFFALESHISYIADSLGQDPAQWRRQNFYTGAVNQSAPPVKRPSIKRVLVDEGNQLIDNVLKISDYRRKWAAYEVLKSIRKKTPQAVPEQGPAHKTPYSQLGSWMERTEGLRGIGVALGYQGSGFLNYESVKFVCGVELTLNAEETLDIKIGVTGSDSDHGSVWAGLASKILEIDKKNVRVSYAGESQDSGPSTTSRNFALLTILIEEACESIRRRRQKAPLPITVRKTARPQKNQVLEERFPQGALSSSGFTQPGWASAVVEVEFDPIGYLPRVRGIWMCVDGGKIFSDDKARKNLKTSIIQALGWAYMEQISYIDGMIPADQFENFDIPGHSEIPRIVIEFINRDSEDPKGIGDLPFSCVPAAFTQAVSQAAGCHFRTIPLKAQDIFSAGRLS